MTDELEELKRRLVVGHKQDGRSVYDPGAKAELVALCMRPGASVSRLARECGVNANQVARWLREHAQGGKRTSVASPRGAPAAFVPVAVVVPSATTPATGEGASAAAVSLQARLPNGVALDLRGMQPQHVGEVIEMLGRLRCSGSTKG